MENAFARCLLAARLCICITAFYRFFLLVSDSSIVNRLCTIYLSLLFKAACVTAYVLNNTHSPNLDLMGLNSYPQNFPHKKTPARGVLLLVGDSSIVNRLCTIYLSLSLKTACASLAHAMISHSLVEP